MRNSPIAVAQAVLGFLAICFLGGCLSQVATTPAPLPEALRTTVYLQPLPHAADRYRFVLSELVALREDGESFPLELALEDIDGSERPARQRRLASGSLPEGAYRGLAVKIERAYVQGEDGKNALLVPSEAVIVPHPFSIVSQEALVLFLSFDSSGLLAGEVRFEPGFSLAIAGNSVPIALKGYAFSPAAGLVTVFDTKHMQVVKAFATGRTPRDMAYDSRQRRLYLALAGEDAILAVDSLNEAPVGRLRLTFGDEPRHLALTADGRTLLSANFRSNCISVIDALGLLETERVPVGEGPLAVVTDPLGLKAYVMNSLSAYVSVVDLTQRSISARIPVDGPPLKAAFNRQGDRLYVISAGSPFLAVIDPNRLAVIQKIFIGLGAATMVSDPSSELLLIANRSEKAVTVVDAAAGMPIDKITLPEPAAALAVDETQNNLFVVLPASNRLLRVDLTTYRVTAEIDCASGTEGILLLDAR